MVPPFTFPVRSTTVCRVRFVHLACTGCIPRHSALKHCELHGTALMSSGKGIMGPWALVYLQRWHDCMQTGTMGLSWTMEGKSDNCWEMNLTMLCKHESLNSLCKWGTDEHYRSLLIHMVQSSVMGEYYIKHSVHEPSSLPLAETINFIMRCSTSCSIQILILLLTSLCSYMLLDCWTLPAISFT